MSENHEFHNENGPDGESIELPPSFFPSDEFSQPEELVDVLVEVRVDGIFERESEYNIHHFMRLSDSLRRLEILIGASEAKAILDACERVIPERPMTHDLLRVMIEKLGATLDRVVIDDVWSDKYYAKVYLDRNGEEIEIDSRPSDAVAIAVRFDAPIFVQSHVFDFVHSD